MSLKEAVSADPYIGAVNNSSKIWKILMFCGGQWSNYLVDTAPGDTYVYRNREAGSKQVRYMLHGSSLEQNFFKRMNNNMFGKKKENHWKHIDAKMLHTKQLGKL